MPAAAKRAPKKIAATPKAKKPGAEAKSHGVSDAAVTRATGKGWDHWFKVLDRFDVKVHGHKAAAEHLHEVHSAGDWWSQMIVVGYERVRGLREKHETPAGFQASASRTVAVPIARLYKAWTGTAPRGWLPDPGFTVRKATPNRSIRMNWVDGKTTVEVMFYDKTTGATPKSQVTIQHGKLASGAAVQKMKRYWGGALDALRESLEK